jgi:O-antigen ligase
MGPYLFVHWLGLIATAFVAVSIPIQYFVKRKRPQNFKTTLKIHTTGNLVAFSLISIHFAQNVGRLSGALQRIGAGFALYLVLAVIMATGIMDRYQTKRSRYIKAAHKYTVIILYLIMLIHALEGFNIL